MAFAYGYIGDLRLSINQIFGSDQIGAFALSTLHPEQIAEHLPEIYQRSLNEKPG